jgi:hypothetical protein
MGKQDSQYKLRGVVEVDEAYLGDKKQNSKRDRGTEKAKVLVAVSTDEKKKTSAICKDESRESSYRRSCYRFCQISF